MCFFCRNKISLKKFEEPYGKLGLAFQDNFYINSFKSTLKNELNKTMQNEDDKNEILNNCEVIKSKTQRIISCGHYFHQSCFDKEMEKYETFRCPLCEKEENILISPLTNFFENNKYLKPIKLDDILDNEKIKINVKESNEIEKFQKISINFLNSLLPKECNLKRGLKFENIIEELIQSYQSYINFLINIYYSNGTTFHKQQTIDIIQNIILSFRYLINTKTIDINEVITYIHSLLKILKGKTDEENTFKNYENMYYHDIFDKLLLTFSILLDFNEFKNLYKYLLNWYLPYFCFWAYLKNLIIKNKYYSLSEEDQVEKIEYNDMCNFLKDNNEQMNNYLFSLLKKLLMIRILTKHENKKDELNYNIKEITMEQLFTLLNLDNLYKSLSKVKNNEIVFGDILKKLPKLLESDDDADEKFILKTKKIINLLINNIQEEKLDSYLINNEMLLQFIPYEFKLIELENNMFDLIEKHIFRECSICHKTAKQFYICLICGEKICKKESCKFAVQRHSKKCSGRNGIFIYMYDMSLTYYNNTEKMELYPLYVDETGIGPNTSEVENVYYLSKERFKATLRDYITYDLH
jgi:hypothetical protein